MMETKPQLCQYLYEWVSWTHSTPYITKKIKKVIERTNSILDTLSTENTQQVFIDPFRSLTARVQFCMVMIQKGSRTPQTAQYQCK